MAEATLSDRLVIEIGANLAPLSQALGEGARAVNAFAGGTVATAMRALADGVNATFRGFERSVVKAARTGEFSMREMVNAILADLARLAIHRSITLPLAHAAEGMIGAIGRAIAGRSLGGPVAPGSAYLVGERGPELFVPAAGGAVLPAVAAAQPLRPHVVINVTTPDAQSFLQSESQIAAMLTRAVLRGQRNL